MGPNYINVNKVRMAIDTYFVLLSQNSPEQTEK
jgi:hypothetical protein